MTCCLGPEASGVRRRGGVCTGQRRHAGGYSRHSSVCMHDGRADKTVQKEDKTAAEVRRIRTCCLCMYVCIYVVIFGQSLCEAAAALSNEYYRRKASLILSSTPRGSGRAHPSHLSSDTHSHTHTKASAAARRKI